MVIFFCIVVLIVIFSFVAIACNKKPTNGKPNEKNNRMTTSPVSNDSLVNRTMRKQEYKNQRDRMYVRHIRLERHKHIWAVLRYVVAIHDVYNSENFYDLDKSINEYKIAYDRLDDKNYTPSKEEIAIAIRYCKIENKRGLCEHEIIDTEEQSIYNWRNTHIDANKILPQVIISFKTYWDGVLTSYKKPTARKNRINYLINHLAEMKTKENLKSILEFEKEADNLISYYNSLLTKD